MGGFLNGTWRDVLSLVSVVGVLIAIWQILVTKHAAAAARKASQETSDRLSASFVQYVVGTAKRQLSDARQSVDNEDRSGAAIRVAEVAEQANQMAQVFPMERGAWVKAATRLREFEGHFRKMKEKDAGARMGVLAEWEELAVKVAAEFDRHHGALGQAKE